MKTPIFDFVTEYAKKKRIRMHMPGHKGTGNTEKYDITEISGADSLYEASGIIRESEENASRLFGADSFYSTEGSSLSIRAMLMLISLYAKSEGKSNLILAARNAHKVFISGIALLGCDVEWIGTDGESYLSPNVTPESVENSIISLPEKPTAVYITSPDYLGNMPNVRGIAEVCHKHGVLLAVDNAHGAYLKFLEKSLHPIDLGADICCDSAHKTLPCLTGAAYLHISKNAPESFRKNAKSALALFGSTSPSYLILASLDKANSYLASEIKEELRSTIQNLEDLKNKLKYLGYTLYGNEPMKLTVKAKPYGYLGTELAEKLEARGIISEFSDRDFLTLMPSTKTKESELKAILEAFASVEKRAPISEEPPKAVLAKRVLSPREAVLSSSEFVSAEAALGRVLADVTVGCPPAVPIIVSGEKVDENAIKAFKYYDIKMLKVVK